MLRKIRDVLRLRLALGLPQRAVGLSLGLSQAAVSEYLGRARRAGVGWPLPDGLDGGRLEVAALSAHASVVQGSGVRAH